MKNQKALTILPILIVALSLIAASFGAFWMGDGQTFEFTTMHGRTYPIDGRGIYKYDSLNYATQARAQDIVTLFIGIPLLITGTYLNRKKSLRGQLLLTGALGYFLYTYTSLVFLAAFNNFFLLYVALFSMSLFAFVLSMMNLNPQEILNRVSDKFPRRWVIAFSFILAIFLCMSWLGLVVPSIFSGEAPESLETYTTMVIQAMDLGIVVPAFVLSAILLLKKNPWGYALSFVVMIKGMMMGAALIAMIIGQILAGVPSDPVMAVMFSLICVSGIITSLVMLKNIK